MLLINVQIGKLPVSTTIIIKYTLFKGLVCSEWVGTRGVIRLLSLITASKPLYDECEPCKKMRTGELM